ncbi:reverse transcriptase-like protein, partial [Trifolium medium]|nr:reverse transcriptase-like protein [Trifolium medium]
GVKTVDNHSKYLGLPVVFGRSKKLIFSLVIDRVWKKVKGWKENCLSRAGKEILIKAVSQAIPNYIMSCYKLPESCCQEIESMLAKFWWGSKEGKRKIHWMSWERLSKSKKGGGMGFGGISNFNSALLGKLCWRLITGEESLMGEFLRVDTILEHRLWKQRLVFSRVMLGGVFKVQRRS